MNDETLRAHDADLTEILGSVHDHAHSRAVVLRLFKLDIDLLSAALVDVRAIESRLRAGERAAAMRLVSTLRLSLERVLRMEVEAVGSLLRDETADPPR